jgi:hypothetical protein
VTRYDYIVSFLAMRDFAAVNFLLLALTLAAPLAVLWRWPKLQAVYVVLVFALVYGLTAWGVLHDLH